MPNDPLALPQPDSKRALRITFALIALTVIGSLGFHWYDHWQTVKRLEAEWNRLGILEPSGGSYQRPRLELKVPGMRQADDRWRKDMLGNTPATLGAEGCAVTSAAMVLASYGADTDPGRLNKLVTEADGYEGAGWLVWEKAAEVTGNIARKAYEDLPSYRLIDENLARGNPVIVRLRTEGGTTHFVVIAGKDGYDYLTRDPGAGAAKGLYPLKEFGSKIEALRFYEKVK
ncbi:MAG: C39 family peptidase [Chthoniobacteraceae bacterium]